MLGLKRTVDWYAEVIGLLFRQLGEFDADFFQVQARDFFIELFRQNVNADFVCVSIFPEIPLHKDLVRE